MRVGIVCGGPSSEAEVSRSSAAGIESGLEQAGHTPIGLEADRALPFSLAAGKVDVVFPIAHGLLGEGGGVQGLLDVMQIPYVGAGTVASATAIDKGLTRLVLADAGVRIAPGRVVRRRDVSTDSLARELVRELGGSLVIKPACAGSAMGVTRLASTGTPDAVARALDLAFSLGERVVCERLIEGVEVTCGVFDPYGTHARALTPIEIRTPGAEYYDTRRRYAEGESEHICPPALPDSVVGAIQRVALRVHEALGARDLSRVDMLVPNDGDPVVLELNTLPGFTPTSLYPDAARHDGIPMPRLCDELVKGAAARGPTRFPAPIPVT